MWLHTLVGMALGALTRPTVPAYVPPAAGRRSPVLLLAWSNQASVSFCMMSRHPLWFAVGKTQASRVMAPVISRLAESGTLTRLFVPLKVSAPPYLPWVVHVAPLIVP